eukprot:scaffold470_cov257-Pinguiococcus_pyrenoidosus.AAC.36
MCRSQQDAESAAERSSTAVLRTHVASREAQAEIAPEDELPAEGLPAEGTAEANGPVHGCDEPPQSGRDAAFDLETKRMVTEQLKMLDRVLAMVLGRVPQQLETKEEHTKWMAREHLQIRQDWKEQLGNAPALRDFSSER